MKKMALFLLAALCAATTGFTDNFILENQTSYPQKQKSKMAIQWASSAKEVEEANTASIQGVKLNPKTLQVLHKTGNVQMAIPKNAEYFRVVVWSKGAQEPDLLTNWINIEPNKTYTLKEEHLVPSVLMLGSGC